MMTSTETHIIDCDAEPHIPDNWTVEEHKKGGQWEFDPSRIELYLSRHQCGGEYIEGYELFAELRGKSVLNANVLDHLLKNQHLIPEEWKGQFIFFWGTTYRDGDGRLCVSYLSWMISGWARLTRWISMNDWYESCPAAIFRS